MTSEPKCPDGNQQSTFNIDDRVGITRGVFKGQWGKVIGNADFVAMQNLWCAMCVPVATDARSDNSGVGQRKRLFCAGALEHID